MTILNIGCGTKTHPDEQFINIDWSMYLSIKENPILSMMAPLFMNKERLAAFRSLSKSVRALDIKKGLPFPDNSIDAVYHCHFLGHLDQPDALNFFEEVLRVLKPGGIHRIVVPDFQLLCESYLDHVKRCEESTSAWEEHNQYITKMIELMVRKKPYGSSHQSWPRRILENMIMGDARKRGETLQWCYDKINLSTFLKQKGYSHISYQNWDSSQIPNWNNYKLDMNEQGGQYKLGSLYLEAQKA